MAARTVELSDGTSIESSTVGWAAGTAPNPLLKDLPCTKERGKLLVNEFLEVVGRPGVWALGDCSAVPDASTGKTSPPTGQHALREGRVLARNLTADIRGQSKRPFVFSTIGQLAAIGKRTGVANICGVNFSGFIAWWLRRCIYLSKLPRLEKKLHVAVNWSLDLLFSKDIVEFLAASETIVSRTAHEHTQSPEHTPLQRV